MTLEEFCKKIEQDSRYNNWCDIIIEPDGNIELVIMGHTNALRELAIRNGTYYDPPVHENYYAHVLNMTGCVSVEYHSQATYCIPTIEQYTVLRELYTRKIIYLNLFKLEF